MAKPAKPVELPEIDVRILSEQQKRIYELAKAGKTQEEIGKELGISTGSVKKQISRIKNKDDKGADTSAPQDTCVSSKLEGFSEILEELEGRQKEIVREYLEGYSIRKIADKRQITRATVQRHLARAKEKLKKPRENLNGKVIVGKIEGPIPEEKQTNLLSPASLLYRYFTGNLPEESEEIREIEKALACQGLGGMKTKKTLLNDRARHINVLAKAGRENWRVFTDEELEALRPLYEDVLRQFFTPLRPSTWVTTNKGLSFLEGYIREKVRALYSNLSVKETAPGVFEVEEGQSLSAVGLLRQRQFYTVMYPCKPLPKGLRLPEREGIEGPVLGVNPYNGKIWLADGVYEIESLVFNRYEIPLEMLVAGDVVEIRGQIGVVRKWNRQNKVQRFEVDEELGAMLVNRFLLPGSCAIKPGGKETA